MLDKKKNDRRRRRRKDGSIDLMADADDQIRELIDAMNEAANVFFYFLGLQVYFSFKNRMTVQQILIAVLQLKNEKCFL